MGITISIVDDSDWVGWAAAAFRLDELYMTSAVQMVRAVLDYAGPRPIDRLNILDHASYDGIQLGRDHITLETLPVFERILHRLRGRFSRRGFVHLHHCQAGRHIPLLTRLAEIFGTRVYAGTGNHNSMYRFNTGYYVCVEPDGTLRRHVDVPASLR